MILQARAEHKACSQQVPYSGRLAAGAEAASVCDSPIIHQEA